MASGSSCGFRPGALHISLQIGKTQPRGWKERTNEQTRTWVSSKRIKLGVYVTLCNSPCICRLSWACILRETSTKPFTILNLAFVNPACVGQQVLAVTFWLLLTLFSALPPSSHYLLLLTVSFSGQQSQTDCSLLPCLVNCSLGLLSNLPSLLHIRSRGRTRPQALCVGFAPKPTKRTSEWRQHKRKRIAPHRVANECKNTNNKITASQAYFAEKILHF